MASVLLVSPLPRRFATAAGQAGMPGGRALLGQMGPLGAVALLGGLCWALASGVSPLVVIGVAAIPLALAVGYRFSFALLVMALVARPLVDNLGNFQLTGGIGIAVIALGALMALHDIRATILLVGSAIPLSLAAYNGLPMWGANAWQEGLRVLSLVAVAAIALTTPTIVSRTTAARVVQLAGAVPAGAAIAQSLTGTGTQIDAVVRTHGTLSQANPAAHFFGLCAIASLALVMEGSSRRIDAAALGFFAIAIVTTGSIGGMIAFVIGVVAYLGLFHRLFSRPMLIGMSSVLLLVAVAFASPLGQGRLAEFTAQTGPVVRENSLAWRFNAWQTVIAAWEHRPVTGLGLGATMVGGILKTNIAHNEYLYVLAEMGIIGLVIVLASILAYVGSLARFRRLGASRHNIALAGSLMLGTAVDSAVDNPVHFSPSMFVLVFILATVWRCSSRERAVAEASDPEGASASGS